MSGHICEETVTRQTGISRATQHLSHEEMHKAIKFPLPVDPYARRYFYRKVDYDQFIRHMLHSGEFSLTREMNLALYCQAMRVLLRGTKDPSHLLFCYSYMQAFPGTPPDHGTGHGANL